MRIFQTSVLTLSLLSVLLHAQGTKADYDRAYALAKTTANKVFRSNVNPHWIKDGNGFWYRVELPEGASEFVRVDVEKGVRRPAFDHAKVAAALAAELNKPVQAGHLPFTEIQPEANGAAIFFKLDGKWRHFDPETDKLETAEPPAAEASGDAKPVEAHPSTRTGPETDITIVNQKEFPVQLYWVDPEGGWRNYAGIRPGEEHIQHTFAGHVWLAVTPEGDVLGAYEAAEGGSRVVLGKNAQPQQRQRNRRRRDDGRRQNESAQWKAELRDNNVWITGRQTNESFQATSDGTANNPYKDFTWSPDGKKLALLRVEAGVERKVETVESSPANQVQPNLRTITYLKPGDKIAHPRLALYDAETRKLTLIDEALYPNPWSLTQIRWAQDNSRFTVLYNQRGHQVLRLLAVDGSSGAISTLIEEEAKTFIDYTNKVWSEMLEKTGELLWMSELRSGWNHLYLFDLKTGQQKNAITKGEWVVNKVERVDEEKRQIWFSASGVRTSQDPYQVHLCRVNFDGSGFVILTEGDGTHRWEFTPDRKYFFDRWSRVDLPTVTELRESEDGKLVCELERADASPLLKTGWSAPERFVAKGRDGKTDIYGVIVRPTNFQPGKKYPVIEKIYAGPQGFFVPKAFGLMTRDRMISELGFIWVQIDGMGTNGRSKAFHDLCWKNLQDAGFPDRIAWMKAAAVKYPEMDITRVGIYGGSAGGQNAMRALLDHNDFYKVAVADCGCHDNRMDKIWWNEQWMGWPVGKEYEAASNVVDAHKLKGHLLLTWGEMDSNVDPASSMQVVNALVKAGRDFDMLVVPGANHGVGEQPYPARRRMDYFVRHLLGIEPPKDVRLTP